MAPPHASSRPCHGLKAKMQLRDPCFRRGFFSLSSCPARLGRVLMEARCCSKRKPPAAPSRFGIHPAEALPLPSGLRGGQISQPPPSNTAEVTCFHAPAQDVTRSPARLRMAEPR